MERMENLIEEIKMISSVFNRKKHAVRRDRHRKKAETGSGLGKKLPFLLKFYLQFFLLKSVFILFFPVRLMQKERWVILFRTDHLGDLLCSVSAIKHFAEYYHRQGMKIAVVTDTPYQDLARRLVPSLDRVIAIRRDGAVSNIFYRLCFLIPFYRLRIFSVISLPIRLNLPFVETFLFARECHCILYEYEKTPLYVQRYLRFYSGIHSFVPLVSVHDQNEKMFREITGEPSAYEPLDLKALLPDWKRRGNEIPEPGKYYVVLPGGSSSKNCWQPEKFAFIINAVQKEFPDCKAVILGSRQERQREKNVLAHLQEPDSVLPLCGKTTLEECFAWIRDAAFTVSNDSGGVHIAAGYQIPSFVIFHGVTFGLCVPNPYYTQAVYFHHQRECFCCMGNSSCFNDTSDLPWPCLRDIQAGEVWEKMKPRVLSILKRHRQDALPEKHVR